MPGKPKLCEICNTTRASCGIQGGKPTHCGKCKLQDMINVTIPKCIVCKNVIANYGYNGDKPSHCKTCKLEDMINIKSIKCITCKIKQPVYGIKGTKKAEYCCDCKLDNMVDIRSRMCEICKTKQPFFGLADDKKATRCKECKMEDMVDIKSKKCCVCKLKYPIYGLPGGDNTHCKDCKDEMHIDVKNHKCIKCNLKQSTYGDPATKLITHCRDCKPETYVDLKHTLCKSELCSTRAHDKYRGYCAWCFQHLFPEDPISLEINNKTYETSVAIALLSYDSTYKHDKPIFIGGCDCTLKRRVDFWKIIGNTILAVEVDENQHNNYDNYDESIRYDDLYMGFSGKWIFIRFNPNNFKDSKGKVTKTPLTDRLEMLMRCLKEQEFRIQNGDNTELVEIIKLYYNGYTV